jgi:hypothetical protein
MSCPPTLDRLADFLKAGLEAVVVDILGLIPVLLGNTFGGGPRPRVR